MIDILNDDGTKAGSVRLDGECFVADVSDEVTADDAVMIDGLKPEDIQKLQDRRVVIFVMEEA